MSFVIKSYAGCLSWPNFFFDKLWEKASCYRISRKKLQPVPFLMKSRTRYEISSTTDEHFLIIVGLLLQILLNIAFDFTNTIFFIKKNYTKNTCVSRQCCITKTHYCITAVQSQYCMTVLGINFIIGCCYWLYCIDFYYIRVSSYIVGRCWLTLQALSTKGRFDTCLQMLNNSYSWLWCG